MDNECDRDLDSEGDRNPLKRLNKEQDRSPKGVYSGQLGKRGKTCLQMTKNSFATDSNGFLTRSFRFGFAPNCSQSRECVFASSILVTEDYND